MTRLLLTVFLAAGVTTAACGHSESPDADGAGQNAPEWPVGPHAADGEDAERAPEAGLTDSVDPQDPADPSDFADLDNEPDPSAVDPPRAGCDHDGAGDVHGVSVGELSALQSDGGPIVVVDVREPYETASGIVERAILYPWSSGVLRDEHDQLRGADPIYVLCGSGNRSRAATEFLVAEGHSCVHDVQGGMTAWVAAGLPTVVP